MTLYKSQTFEDQVIELDGNQFTNCIFKRCEFHYRGKENPTLKYNEFQGCKWEFQDAAMRTLQFMAALYHGGAKELIDDTFENIQKGFHIHH